jgi:hypothetical protein
MIKPSTAAYNWDEARAHIELMGHANVGLTQIAAFRPGNFDDKNFLGVFEPGRYSVAIDHLRQLQRQDSTLSFYVAINPLVDAALPYAANQMRPGSDILAYGRVPKWISGEHVARRVNVLLDLDPPINDKDRTLVTADMIGGVHAVADKVMGSREFGDASLFDSGFGAYVLARIPPGTYEQEAIKAVNTEVGTRFAIEKGVSGTAWLDPDGGLTKVMGLAGTLITKGPRERWRRRVLLHPSATTCMELAERLRSWKPIPQVVDVLDVGAQRSSTAALEARIAKWCPGYQALWRATAVRDRSDVAFHLALKMQRTGWSWADIQSALRVWADGLRLENKIERILKSLPRQLRDARFKDVLPSHKFVVKHLGYCPCDGLCDVETAIRLLRKKQKLKEVSVDWEMLRRAVPPVLKDARDDLAHFYGINLEDLLKNPSAVFLSSGPPGIGKTHLMLRLGRFLRMAVFTPRTDEFDKLVGDLRGELDADLLARATKVAACLPDGEAVDSQRVVIIKPRHEICDEAASLPLFTQLEKMEQAHLGESRVCQRCPRYEQRSTACSYYKQFDLEKPSTVVAASAWLRLPRFLQLVRNAHLIVMDEDPLDYAIEEIKMDTRGLKKARRLIQNHLSAFAEPVVHLLDAIETAAGEPELTVFRVPDGKALAKQIQPDSFKAAYLRVEASAEASSLPPIPVPRILSAVLAVDGKRANLIVGAGEVRWRRFRPFPVKKPVVILDATGDKCLYQQIFPGREIEVDEATARLVASVWQICDERLPKKTLDYDHKLNEMKGIVMALHRTRTASYGDGFGVIARKDVLERMALPASIQTAHYWGQRGTRDFENCHTLVLVGVAEPNFKDIELQADQLFGRSLSRDQIEKLRSYECPSGHKNMSWASMVWTYDDPNLRAFYERAREGEMLQAAFRIRPLEGKHKLVVVLSNLPLSGLPPTELMSLFDLKVRLGLEQPSTRTRILRVQEQLRHELGREPSHSEIAGRMGCDRSLVTHQLA